MAQITPELILEHSNFKNFPGGAFPQTPLARLGRFHSISPPSHVSHPKTSSYATVFRDNHANYGGTIYVADNTNSGACSSNIECFIQTLALYQYSTIHTLNILSSHNTANEQGANLFGGLLDRCIPNPFAEVYLKQRIHYSVVSYLGNISNLRDLDTISSLPVRVCFCTSENEPDCSFQPPAIIVKTGEVFTVSVPLVAVDQVNHSVNANIISSLS